MRVMQFNICEISNPRARALIHFTNKRREVYAQEVANVLVEELRCQIIRNND